MTTQFNNVSQIPNFGQKWSLVITGPPDSTGKTPLPQSMGESGWNPETMRIVFEVNLVGYMAHGTHWTAKIELYNLSADQAQQFLLGQGSTVELSAGYQAGPYGIIFAGTVYAAYYERPDVVDSKVTLMCYTGLANTIGNFASMRGVAKMTQAALIANMCKGATVPIPIDPSTQATMAAVDKISKTKLPRARPVFGDPIKYINEVSAANNLQSWYGSNGVVITRGEDTNSDATITYTSTSGILGVPQQTYDSHTGASGVNLVVALDPRLRVQNPPMQINIASSIIRQMEYQPPSWQPLLDANGNYLVNGLQFRGDSRGNQWETEIVALTSTNGMLNFITESVGGVEMDRRAPVGH